MTSVTPLVSRICCACSGRSGLKASVHGVLVKQRLHPQVTDLFGVGGRQWLNTAPLDAAYRLRVNALLPLIDAMDFEITAVAGPLRAALGDHAGFRAVQKVPGVGPTLAAIFVAEIGDVTRFASPAHLSSWAGLTPKHRESDTVVRVVSSVRRRARLSIMAMVIMLAELSGRVS
jgi:transposase